jgi:uncharacterized phage infection (PIP) family protein YhgE
VIRNLRRSNRTSSSCGCNNNDFTCEQNLEGTVPEMFRGAVREIENGINESQVGLANIVRGNTREGIREVQAGICRMEAGIRSLREELRNVDTDDNRDALRQIQEGICLLEEGIDEMEAGIDSIERGNRREGIRQIQAGICTAQEGLEQVIAGLQRLELEDEDECEGCRVRNIRIDISFDNDTN